ncbi:MAG: hypothetical protein O3A46_01235, partial [Candidatus Poribacteria bacterium]|nr:hypothetical protein [Candidatus Poribacteria bacterium]
MSEQELNLDATLNEEAVKDVPTFRIGSAIQGSSSGKRKSPMGWASSRLAWQRGIVSVAVLTIAILGLFFAVPTEYISIQREKTFFPLYFPFAGPSNIIAIGALIAFVANIVSILGFLMQVLSSHGKTVSNATVRSVVVIVLGFAFAVCLFGVAYKNASLNIGFSVYMTGVVYLLLAGFAFAWVACLLK